MVDDLIARCRKLLEFPGGRETAKDWPVSIPCDDLRELLGRLAVHDGPPPQPWPLSIRADHAIKRALHPVDWL